MTELEPKILCSVCIATYQRVQLLEKLLISLENQILPDKINLEIIIVDNDSNKSAEPVFQKYENQKTIKYKYFTQPVKNISLTRNISVKEASGVYLLFIDDDEIASPEWIKHLVEAIEKFKADAVFGPVLPEFHKETPFWMREPKLYYNPITDTGKKATHKWTSNCIVSASLLKKIEEPFDARYGLTGGEDTHLFNRLENQGARCIYCKEAFVSEFLPLKRTKISYLFLRNIVTGTSYARRLIEFAGKKRIFVRVVMLIKALLYATISMLFVIIHFPFDVKRTKWLLKVASNIGKLLAVFNLHYKIYK